MSNSLWPHGLQQARLPCPSYLLKFVQTHVHWTDDTIQPSLSSPSPSIFPSVRVFSNESALCIRCPKYWSFSFSISPSNEYSGFLSFRMDWFDLLAVQRTLKSLLQHNNLKALVFWHSEIIIMPTSEYGREPNGMKHIKQSGQCLAKKSYSIANIIVAVVYLLSCIGLFWDSMYCNLPGSSAHAVFQAKMPKWVAIFFSKGSSQPRDQTCISCTAGRFFTAEPPGKLTLLCRQILPTSQVTMNIK